MRLHHPIWVHRRVTGPAAIKGADRSAGRGRRHRRDGSVRQAGRNRSHRSGSLRPVAAASAGAGVSDLGVAAIPGGPLLRIRRPVVLLRLLLDLPIAHRGGDPHRICPQRQTRTPYGATRHDIRPVSVVGEELANQIDGLEGNGIVLVIAVGFTLWAGIGVVRVAQDAFNTMWSLSIMRWPSFFPKLFRALAALLVVGSALSCGDRCLCVCHLRFRPSRR